jgi:hypothetical protein
MIMKLTEFDQDVLRAAYGEKWTELAVLCAEETGGARLFYLDAHARIATVPGTRCLNWDETTYQQHYAALEAVPAAGGDMVPGPVRLAVLVSYGDHSTTTNLDAANYRWLHHRWSENVSDPLVFGLGLAVRIGDPRWSEDDLTELISIMNGLVDSPLISEKAHAEYENEKREEWWDGYRRELLNEVDDVMATDDQPLDAEGEPYTWETAPLAATYADDSRDRDDLIRAELYERVEEWIWEGATSIWPTYGADTLTDIVGELFNRPAHVAVLDDHTVSFRTTSTAGRFPWWSGRTSRHWSATRWTRDAVPPVVVATST